MSEFSMHKVQPIGYPQENPICLGCYTYCQTICDEENKKVGFRKFAIFPYKSKDFNKPRITLPNPVFQDLPERKFVLKKEITIKERIKKYLKK